MGSHLRQLTFFKCVQDSNGINVNLTINWTETYPEYLEENFGFGQILRPSVDHYFLPSRGIISVQSVGSRFGQLTFCKCVQDSNGINVNLTINWTETSWSLFLLHFKSFLQKRKIKFTLFYYSATFYPIKFCIVYVFSRMNEKNNLFLLRHVYRLFT